MASRSIATLSIMLFINACGESDHGPGHAGDSGAHGGHAGTTTDKDGGATGGSSGGSGGTTAAEGGGTPQAPVLLSVAPLTGVLHVEWRNTTPDCTKIELLRNTAGGAFTVAYTLTGAATSQHDTQATGASEYCYKVRCVKGSDTSPESNEKCATP